MSYASPTAGPAAALRTALALAPLTALAPIVGCDSFPTSQVEEEAPLAVTHTDPAEAEQGDTLTVQIFGEGFVEGDFVSWEQDGVVTPLVTVNSVTYVSETELLAHIRIALDTEIGLYDVAVSRKRKKGVGSEDRAVAAEVFEVKEYTPVSLGWVPSIWREYGYYLVVEDINDHGVIVGRDGCCAFRWSEGDGMLQFGGENSRAMSINNDGVIVGFRVHTESTGDFSYVPFIFEHGAITEFTSEASMFVINDAGTIAGSMTGAPVVWLRDAEGEYGGPIDLPLPAGELFGEFQDVSGMVINHRGDIAGTLRYDPPLNVGVFWRSGTDGTYDAPILLDRRGGMAYVRGIDDVGWIVGDIHIPNSRAPLAVIWHPDDYTRAILLGSQGSWGAYANDIDNKRQVVGVRMGEEFQPHKPFPGGTSQATLWQLDSLGRTTQVVPLLPVPEYSDSDAVAINADGWIVGLSSVVAKTLGWQYDGTIWRPDQ